MANPDIDLIRDILEDLSEDELTIFAGALRDLRRQGFGELHLRFRNGFIFGIKGVLDYNIKDRENGGKS